MGWFFEPWFHSIENSDVQLDQLKPGFYPALELNSAFKSGFSFHIKLIFKRRLVPGWKDVGWNYLPDMLDSTFNITFSGLKTIVNALFLSMKPLSEVLFIMIFLLVVIALIGLQSYMGVLRQKCVEIPPNNISDEEWYEWVQDEDHTMDGDADTILCGNSTGAGLVEITQIFAWVAIFSFFLNPLGSRCAKLAHFGL